MELLSEKEYYKERVKEPILKVLLKDLLLLFFLLSFLSSIANSKWRRKIWYKWVLVSFYIDGTVYSLRPQETEGLLLFVKESLENKEEGERQVAPIVLLFLYMYIYFLQTKDVTSKDL